MNSSSYRAGGGHRHPMSHRLPESLYLENLTRDLPFDIYARRAFGLPERLYQLVMEGVPEHLRSDNDRSSPPKTPQRKDLLSAWIA
jgi:hypothetical protein